MIRAAGRRSPHLLASATVAAAASALIAGCGFGPGGDLGRAEVLITRDYGRVVMFRGEEAVNESDDAMRLLTRSAGRVETRYGGGFVESIDGYGSESGQAGSTDWFFFLDGVESPVGALDAKVQPGQSVWWDRRNWWAAMHVPAVVGSWPRPFSTASGPVEVQCQMKSQSACEGIERDIERTGADTRVRQADGSSEPLRVLVGSWSRLRSDPAARALEGGPSTSGVYARLERRDGHWLIQALDDSGQPSGRAFQGGLVAAVSDQTGHVTWIVAGTDDASVPGNLEESALGRRYAVVYPRPSTGISKEVPRP